MKDKLVKRINGGGQTRQASHSLSYRDHLILLETSVNTAWYFPRRLCALSKL